MSDTPPAQGDSIVLGAFKGIRNTIASERLSAEDLERARNIDLDDAGQARRRRGYTRVASGSYHSLFTRNDGSVLGVKDGDLGIVRPDYTHTVLQSGVGSALVAYVQVGGDVYYSSRAASGIVLADDTTASWGAAVSPMEWMSPVVDETATLPLISGQSLGAPPLATSLAYYSGRIYLAVGTIVWATELYMYRHVDKTRTYLPFEEAVTALGAVDDGLYVGTTAALWFLSGRFGDMRRTQVLNYGVVPGSVVTHPDDNPPPGGASVRASLMLLSTRGVVACRDGGVAQNLTQTRVILPVATSAAAMMRQQDGIDQYVGVLNSGGTPTSTARVGDYVDAEIRRALPGA